MTANSPVGFAVIVVAHRQYETLSLCLDGLRSAAAEPSDVIFVDNGSKGLLADWARNAFPDVTVLALDENRLFCGGYNAGLRFAMKRGYKYALIVNADTEVIDQSFIHRMIDVMKRRPKAAFVGPKVFLRRQDEVQNTIFRFPTVLYFMLAWLPFRLFPSILRPDLENERVVDTLNGVCVLCRLDALREIGLMDETFGAYVEDTDWSWRARRAGWESVYTPVPSVIHHEEPTGYEHYAFKTFLLKRNMLRWYLKTGRRMSALTHAAAALSLARLRVLLANATERQNYKEFADRLSAVYSRLLANEELGPWYGAPLDTPGYGPALLADVGECSEVATATTRVGRQTGE